MENKVLGLHHITAIADNAKRNYDFYTGVLGLRLVKKTVNFDDPGTYHFYYGNEEGSPGTILTFFPWEGVGRGTNGSGMATHIGYSVPAGSLEFWKDRLIGHEIAVEEKEIFGERLIGFSDPDGLQLQFTEASAADVREGWATPEVEVGVALKGFQSVGLTVRRMEATANVLNSILGYELVQEEGNRFRFATGAIGTANRVEVIEDTAARPGKGAGGTNHHIAFRVENEDVLMAYREKVLGAGLDITHKIDRNYFFSLYFREPGGVLFEIATDNPGFATDETRAELGRSLRLPARYESIRDQIEKALPEL